jgi:hypothetical protein
MLDTDQVVLHLRCVPEHDQCEHSNPIGNHRERHRKHHRCEPDTPSIFMDLSVQETDCQGDDEEMQTAASSCNLENARGNMN